MKGVARSEVATDGSQIEAAMAVAVAETGGRAMP